MFSQQQIYLFSQFSQQQLELRLPYGLSLPSLRVRVCVCAPACACVCVRASRFIGTNGSRRPDPTLGPPAAGSATAAARSRVALCDAHSESHPGRIQSRAARKRVEEADAGTGTALKLLPPEKVIFAFLLAGGETFFILILLAGESGARAVAPRRGRDLERTRSRPGAAGPGRVRRPGSGRRGCRRVSD